MGSNNMDIQNSFFYAPQQKVKQNRGDVRASEWCACWRMLLFHSDSHLAAPVTVVLIDPLFLSISAHFLCFHTRIFLIQTAVSLSYRARESDACC